METPDKISIGDIYRINDDEYMLAQIGPSKIMLINLTTGNRWNDDVIKVKDPDNISVSEFRELITDQLVDFIGKGIKSIVRE